MSSAGGAGPARGPLAWMAANSVAANLLMLVFLVGGLIMGSRIKQEVFPDFTIDVVTVSVPYPGASPEEVEQGIVLAVEEAVQGLDGVDQVTALAREGLGTVSVEALVGADIQKLAQEVRNEVDRITSFPLDAEEPRVEIATRRREVVNLVVFGPVTEQVLRDTAERLRDGLLQEPGITQVDLSGARNMEISVEISQDNLRRYGLTLEELAGRLRVAAVEVAGGGIKTEAGEVLLRMKERRDWGAEFARIPVIVTADGTKLSLAEIATVIDGFEDTDYFATYNGQPAVMVDVYRVGDQTPISVAEAVSGYTERFSPSLPPGVSLATLNDRSEVYKQRLSLLMKNGLIGLCLVFLLLGVFLEARLAFWVAMGIPISFLGGLLFLPGLGLSINMISMFAFIVALGIVVDDAIVVGENIYHHRQAGVPFLEAALLGVREVAMPVTFSILTNIVAFLPLAFVPGVVGRIFSVLPLVVITVLIISLVESLVILPAHLGHQRAGAAGGWRGWLHRRQQGFSRWFERQVRDHYGSFLERSIRNRYLTLALGLALMVITISYVQSGRLGMVLFPRIEADYAFVQAVLPYGSAVARTEAVRDRLVAAAREVMEGNGGEELVRGIYAQIGGGGFGAASGGHALEIRVYLTTPDRRPISTAEFVRQWREKVGEIVGLESLSLQADRGGPGSGAALTVELTHPDLKILEAAGEDLAERLADFAITKDINDGFSPGKEQLDFTIRPEGLALGLTAQSLARQVRSAFYGAEVLRQQRGRNEIKVMVRLPQSERISEYHLEELMVRSPGGAEAPLLEVVDVQRGRAYTEINRRAGRRVIFVTADVEPQRQAGQVIKALEAEALPELLELYPGLRYSFEGRQKEMADSMRSLYLGLLMALLGIYVLLAVPFKSYIQPAIVMFSIPFGIVGAVLGHMLMGYSLSVMSMFGVLALSGVVVNDSLVLIHYANQLRRQKDAGAHAAALAAGVQRFRPVLLTTLTTFGGLAPMIFETSRQARFMIPMALSLGFGILFATFITLLMVPSLYLVVEDLRRTFRRGD